MTITQVITAPGTAPARSQAPATFIANADAHVAWQATLVSDINTWGGQANTLAGSLNALAAGTAVAIPYTFSTTTTDSDPGAGTLRLDNATQNTATTIRADLVGSDGSTWTDVLSTFDDSTSTIKGYIRLVKVSDATKWIIFSVSALASPAGYKNITVAVVSASSATPFANGDGILLEFTRNGDKGDTGASGTSGALVYLSTVTASATAIADVETGFSTTYDDYAIIFDTTMSAADILITRWKFAGAYDTGSNYVEAGALASTSTAAATSLRCMFGVTGTAASGTMTLFGINSAAVKHATVVTSGTNATPGCNVSVASHMNTATTTLQGVRFFANSGSTLTGTFKLYGIAKA